MAKGKTSKIWVTPKEELQILINESSSLKEVLEKLGFGGNIGRHRDLNKRVKDDNLDTSGLVERRQKRHKVHLKNIAEKFSLEEILIENSTYDRASLRRRLIKDKAIPYKCFECDIVTWKGKELSLHIDHKNGISNDNRIENLRFLCPNCHQQTDTWGAKNRKDLCV